MLKHRTFAKTPPMGWNSWDCFGPGITEEQLKENADYMAEHLKEFGWECVVCDIQWYEPKAKGYDYGKYVMPHPPRGYAWTGSDYPDIEITFCKDFLSAVKAKIKKLNNGKYAPLSRYDLLVLSEIDIEDWMPEKLLEKLISYKTEELNYSYIYLLALNGLFRFDIISREWCVRGTQADMFGLSWMARQMVEDGETDDKTQ